VFHSKYVPILQHLWDVVKYWSIWTYSTSIWCPRWGWPSQNFAQILGISKLASWAIVWRCLHDAAFNRFGTVPACDRRTDGQTHNDSIYRSCIALCRKWVTWPDHAPFKRGIASAGYDWYNLHVHKIWRLALAVPEIILGPKNFNGSWPWPRPF